MKKSQGGRSRVMSQGGYGTHIMAGMLLLGFVLSMACSANPPKPSSTGGKQEIKKDSDLFFEKLEQEEHRRSTSAEESG